LAKRAVEEVPVSSIYSGFYSRLFIVPKKRGGMRPVIDLSILNTYLDVPHFKMETNRSIRAKILNISMIQELPPLLSLPRVSTSFDRN
jgi:hypothetical protein